MKKYLVFFVTILLFMQLSACAKTGDHPITNYDFTEQTDNVAVWTKTDTIAKHIHVKQRQIALPKDSRVVSYIMHANKIYYALDYEPLFENPLGNKQVPKFTADYQTELHVYDLQTKEDKLLYKCRGSQPRALLVSGATDTHIAFLEFSVASPTHAFFPNNWTIKILELASANVENIATTKFTDMEEIAPNPTVTQQGIYWFAQENPEKPNTNVTFSLQYYDFTQKEVFELKKNCYLDDVSEPLYVEKGNYALYQAPKNFAKGEGKKTNELQYSILNLLERTADAQINLKIPGLVAYPLVNTEYAVWSNGFRERTKLLIFNKKKQELKLLKLDKNQQYSSYMLLDKYLFLTQEDVLYCYDLTNFTVTHLLASQIKDHAHQNEQLFLGRLKKQGDKVSMKIATGEDVDFTLLEISVNK